MPKSTFIDLFAGIGGFHFAFSELGYECLLAVEMNPKCRQIYELNHKLKPIGDIRSLTRREPARAETEYESHEDIEQALRKTLKGITKKKGLPKVDFICAGFPCQPFSKSGKQEGALDKTRGTLFHDILLLTKVLKPKHLILENVRNLAGPKHRETLATILGSLETCGYKVSKEPLILSPHYLPPPYGAPQARERVFILATREELVKNGDAPNPEVVAADIVSIYPARPREWSLSKILSKDKSTTTYAIGNQEVEWITAWNDFVKGINGHLPGFPLWLDAMTGKLTAKSGDPDWKKDFIRKNKAFYESNKEFIDQWKVSSKAVNFPASRRKFEWQASKFQKTRAERDLEGLAIQLRPSGIRVKPPTYLPALVAITQTSIIGPKVKGNTSGKYRRITPTEAAKLQGMNKIKFEDQSDAESYRQLGNAVNVGVIQLIAEKLTGAPATSTRAAGGPPGAKSGGKRGRRRKPAPRKKRRRRKHADGKARQGVPRGRPPRASPAGGRRK